jgi:hypothetical protein
MIKGFRDFIMRGNVIVIVVPMNYVMKQLKGKPTVPILKKRPASYASRWFPSRPHAASSAQAIWSNSTSRGSLFGRDRVRGERRIPQRPEGLHRRCA